MNEVEIRRSMKELIGLVSPAAVDRIVNQNQVVEGARELSGQEGATFSAQEVRTLIDIIDDRQRVYERTLRETRARHAALARSQPFFKDTEHGVRQAWVREQIARRIEGNPADATHGEAVLLAKLTMEGRT